MCKIKEKLFSPISGSPLALFRIFFGVIMFMDVNKHFEMDFIYRYFISPKFHFSYLPGELAYIWPGNGMYIHFIGMGILSCLIAVGLFYRVSITLYFILSLYVFTIDKALYNNHYYLILLVSFLMMFINAHCKFSIDALFPWNKNKIKVPFWNIAILRAQIILVYLFGALAKLNFDWFRGEPIRGWLYAKSNTPIWGALVSQEWVVYLFAYGGFLFDLTIGFMLLYRKTRLFAALLVMFFFAVNNWMLNIGIFPLLMVAMIILFLEDDWLVKWNQFFSKDRRQRLDLDKNIDARYSIKEKYIFICICVYFAVQVVLPLRHWLYPGDVRWTGEGGRYAWRMRLNSKKSSILFIVIDHNKKEYFNYDPSIDLTGRQNIYMGSHPDMIIQYVQYLKSKLEKAGRTDVSIQAISSLALNDRSLRPFIDPSIDLTKAQYSIFRHNTWILPFSK